MKTKDGRELYFSLDVITTIKRLEAQYVYRETGLTLDTLYNDNDYRLYNEVARELIPEPLDIFLLSLMLKLPALEEEASSSEEGKIERLLTYLEEIIEEGEDGGL